MHFPQSALEWYSSPLEHTAQQLVSISTEKNLEIWTQFLLTAQQVLYKLSYLPALTSILYVVVAIFTLALQPISTNLVFGGRTSWWQRTVNDSVNNRFLGLQPWTETTVSAFWSWHSGSLALDLLLTHQHISLIILYFSFHVCDGAITGWTRGHFWS